MTRTISLIIGIAVTALAVAVPTALGEGRLAGSDPLATPMKGYVDANQRGTLVQPIQIERRTDAWDRTAPTPQSSTYRDAGQRSTQPVGRRLGIVDANQRGVAPSTPTVVRPRAPVASVDWPQLGIGFGVGIVLALGLMLAFRTTRQRRSLTDPGHSPRPDRPRPPSERAVAARARVASARSLA